jgi:NAD+ synthase (glutamine-hydrolysing)
MVVRAVAAGDAAVERDARRLARLAPGEPLGDAKALAGRLLTTVYMGSDNSSAETRAR